MSFTELHLIMSNLVLGMIVKLIYRCISDLRKTSAISTTFSQAHGWGRISLPEQEEQRNDAPCSGWYKYMDLLDKIAKHLSWSRAITLLSNPLLLIAETSNPPRRTKGKG